jgi:hypothetical protein
MGNKETPCPKSDLEGIATLNLKDMWIILKECLTSPKEAGFEKLP